MAGLFPRKIRLVSRNGVRASLASALLMAGAGSVHDASATNETRTLSFHHTHSNEDLTVTFKRNGRYDDEALKTLNHYLRDWRSQEETVMNPALFDIIWEVYRDVDGRKPIQIVSAYRSPSTNAMLRRRSSGVARFSQHMLGHAMDLFIPDVALEKIRFAGLRLQRGGVGFYPTSGSPFVHLDSGNIRYWPRMNRDELVRLFPDGRTVYLPADGKPLPGYELALADIEQRGDGTTVAPPAKSGFFASLFGNKKQQSDEDDEGGTVVAADKTDAPVVVTASTAAVNSANTIASLIPLPRPNPVRPAATFQVASASSQDVVIGKPLPVTTQATLATEPKLPAEAKPKAPADIINARGFWGDLAQPEKSASDAAIPQTVTRALAYAPPAPAPDRDKVVAASGPPPLPKTASALVPTPPSAGNSDFKSGFTTMTHLAASDRADELWTRAMILTPSVIRSLSSTLMGEQNLTVMRAHFTKPETAVAMTFSNDPAMGMICERFTGPAVTPLTTTSFRTAALR